jgi:TPP-dependent pyruvate/acetoin dehydrogenase alpha subunit
LGELVLLTHLSLHAFTIADLLAVYSAVSSAVTMALAGNGPTLIECRTYRVGFHDTSDNPNEYRDEAEVAAAIEHDPIQRVRVFATGSGWWSAEQEIEAAAQIRRDIDSAQHTVEALPRPGPAAIFEHVYASPNERLRQQRAEALSLDGLVEAPDA